ncbi:MAG: hypothetical protein V4560_00050 [Bacteroidota bacterium]
MIHRFHYDTISEAIAHLRLQGYTIDFNLNANQIEGGDPCFSINELEIVDVYRYEGDSDPADESIIYALQGPMGAKGVFVANYGANADSAAAEILKQLHYKS